MKQLFFTAILLVIVSLAMNAQNKEIFAIEGKAIKGYDAVAFFKENKPIKGKDSLSFTYKDVQWLFCSRENLESFKSNPDRYVPQYGGYCAYGTAQGHKAPTETETWTIVNEKLYFNYNKRVKEAWLKDQSALIEKADKQWPTVKEQ